MFSSGSPPVLGNGLNSWPLYSVKTQVQVAGTSTISHIASIAPADSPAYFTNPTGTAASSGGGRGSRCRQRSLDRHGIRPLFHSDTDLEHPYTTTAATAPTGTRSGATATTRQELTIDASVIGVPGGHLGRRSRKSVA